MNSGSDAPASEAPRDLEPPPEISVILPAHNEIMLVGSTITNLVSGLERRRRSFEIVVVENGSTDGTLRLVRLLAAQLPHVRVLSLAASDYGAALAAGFRDALGALIVSFDVDYYDLSFFDAALRLLDSGEADLVLASKRAPGARDRRPLLRRLLTAGFAFALHRVLDLPVSDPHGMKALSASAVVPLIEETALRGSLFDVELVARADRAGLALRELPVAVRELRPPRTSVARRTVEAAVGLVRLRLLLGRADGSEHGEPKHRGRVRRAQEGEGPRRGGRGSEPAET
jgi:glycosyltransferase involved in cell wall biosynthesis